MRSSSHFLYPPKCWIKALSRRTKTAGTNSTYGIAKRKSILLTALSAKNRAAASVPTTARS
jgi:hypothetical protein